MMKKSFLCILLACVLALVCGLVACGKTDDNSNGGGDGKLDWAVNANTTKDDMTVSVHCDVKTGESLSGAKVSLYYGDELVESKDAAEEVTFEAPHHGMFTVKLEKGEQTLGQAEAKVWASSYRIAYFTATLPVTMFTSTVFSDQSENLAFLEGESGLDKNGACVVPTYIYLGRQQTFNWNELPENMYAFPGAYTDAWVEYKTAADFVGELYAMDSASTFSFHVQDNYSLCLTYLAWYNRIPDEKFEATVWTDGTGTYSMLDGIAGKTMYDKFLGEANELKSEIYAEEDAAARYALADGYVTENSAVYQEKFGGNTFNFYNTAWAFALACEEDNVYYAVNSVEGVFNDDAALKALAEENLSAIALNTMLSALRADKEGFRAFEFLYQTRWTDEGGTEHSYNDIFGASDKPNLLILGTNVAGEAVSDTQPYTFLEYYDYLQKTYGDTYDIFYKAHPSYPITAFEDGRADLFEQDGVIDITPAQIPVELFMFFYDDVYICGYFGSSFYSSQKGQTICFFNKESVVAANETAAAMMEAGIFDNTAYLGDVAIKG